MRVERITIATADVHAILHEANCDGVAHSFTQDTDGEPTEINLLWEPDATVNTLRIILKPNGTWIATLDVVTGRADE